MAWATSELFADFSQDDIGKKGENDDWPEDYKGENFSDKGEHDDGSEHVPRYPEPKFLNTPWVEAFQRNPRRGMVRISPA